MEFYLEAFRVVPRVYIAVYIVALVAVSAVPVPQINIGSTLNGNSQALAPASTTRLQPQDVRTGRVIQSQPQFQQQQQFQQQPQFQQQQFQQQPQFQQQQQFQQQPQFQQQQQPRQQQQQQPGQTNQRFLGGLFQPQIPQTNPNHQFANTGAALGIGGIAGVAGVNCLLNNNCDLNFKPSIGGAVDADGNFKPQLGITTQVGKGDLATHFTGGLQLDGNSQNGVGTFVGAGVSNGGDGNGVAVGAQTQFGFSQNQNGQTQAVGQLGGNVQAPSLGGVNFGQQGRPGAIGGAQPHFLGNPFLSGLFQG
jgi:hypothetical protein